jgi:hypothetical protein
LPDEGIKADNDPVAPLAPQQQAVHGLDHDDFGSNRSKIMNVIDSNILERDAGGKPLHTFPHPALALYINAAQARAIRIGPETGRARAARGRRRRVNPRPA